MKTIFSCLKTLSGKRDFFPNGVIFLLAVAVLFTIFNLKYWKQDSRVINWDVLEYYSYLPAVFIQKDIRFEFTDADPAFFSGRFWTHEGPGGSRVLKMSMGMSTLYAPFFLVAHSYASLSRHYVADGFSPPYHLALLLGGVFHLVLGLIFLKKVLLNYFSPVVTSITLFLTVAGTNLFFYASFEAAMSHAYSFGLFSAFLFFTIGWHDKPELKKSIILGLLTGLITLVRPSNVLILLFFILYGITNKETLLHTFSLLLKHSCHLLLMGFFFMLVWLPQLLYWKHVTGEWLYWSYGDQGFFFDNPQILNGLFSFRKGWFIYTPLMMLAAAGILLLLKKNRQFFLPMTIFISINIYVILSWWCWWYGGSFGLRAFIESYALLTIPLAAIVEKIFHWRLSLKLSAFLLLASLTVHSIFQSFQYHYGAIHWDSMNREAWFHTFGKLKPDKEFQKLLHPPDYEMAMKGMKEYPPSISR
jgi:hypothetical protein